MKVKIIGAGSAGNHLAEAARRMGWNVTVTDTDENALVRMRYEIWPKRYGAWDDEIALFQSGDEPKGGYDIIMVGTPPDVRIPIAIEALKERPRLLHLEKPLSGLDIEDTFKNLIAFNIAVSDFGDNEDIFITVGYNHAVSRSVQKAVELLKQDIFGEIRTIDVEFREHWSGIFSAHPWLSEPKDSYLGHWRRGGGAGGEHSHALHLFIYFASILGFGSIEEVRALFSFQKSGEAEYDELAHFLLKTETGFIGRVTQDVLTFPPRKQVHILGTTGYLECSFHSNEDIIVYALEKHAIPQVLFFKKSRSDDFYQEMRHYDDLLSGKIAYEDSPLNIELGGETLRVLYKAHYKYRNLIKR